MECVLQGDFICRLNVPSCERHFGLRLACTNIHRHINVWLRILEGWTIPQPPTELPFVASIQFGKTLSGNKAR